jgi:hypothetical protein
VKQLQKGERRKKKTVDARSNVEVFILAAAGEEIEKMKQKRMWMHMFV